MGGDPVPQLPAPWSYFRLTAFVLKSFAQARSFVFIDPRELAAAKGWIVRRQQVDGSFPATGRILNKDIQVSCPACSWCRRAGRRGLPLGLGVKPRIPVQGGIHGSVPLTAYVVAALLETDVASEVSTGA